jgi:hypothetical protein
MTTDKKELISNEGIKSDEQSIDDHLRQALSHLVVAINKSIAMILRNDAAKKEVGQKWEAFLGQFFGYVREKGKENRVNLMGLISFARLRKW